MQACRSVGRDTEERRADRDRDEGDDPRYPVELAAQRCGRGPLVLRELGDARQARCCCADGLDRGSALALDDETARVDRLARPTDAPARSRRSASTCRPTRRAPCRAADPRRSDRPRTSSTTSPTTSSSAATCRGAPSRSDRGPLRQQVPQPFGGVLGALLLREGEQPVEHDDDEDRDAELRHARQKCQRHRPPRTTARRSGPSPPADAATPASPAAPATGSAHRWPTAARPARMSNPANSRTFQSRSQPTARDQTRCRDRPSAC